MHLELKGINYDVGTFWTENQSSRPDFDSSIVRQEMAIIAKQLHCNAVRISGQDIDRLVLAAECALENSLAVWISPALINANEDELMSYLAECAKRAGVLLSKGAVTFVVGCEWTIFEDGMLPGSNVTERVKNMTSPFVLPKMVLQAVTRSLRGKDPRPEVTQLNHLLKRAAETVHAEFSGKITYAAGEWEEVDWRPFDIVGVDCYRSSQSRQKYSSKLQEYKRHGKPVVVTEFGCCTYKGADKKGGSGWRVVSWHDGKATLKRGLVRDEQVQAKYLKDQLNIFNDQKLTGAFAYTFINSTYTHSDNPENDLDMASYGIVKPIAAEQQQVAISWKPKAAFTALAKYYS
jgi:hypothetical protein